MSLRGFGPPHGLVSESIEAITMKLDRLPTRLKQEPLIDAVFELRFDSKVRASSILPGLLYSGLDGVKEAVTKLPQSELPTVMRDADPALAFAPLVNFLWQHKFVVFVGDRSVGVACRLPYPGWATFRAAIEAVGGVLRGCDFISTVTRYSLKYVDLLPRAEIASQVKGLDLQLTVGEHRLLAEPCTVRIEVPRGEVINLVQITIGGQVQLVNDPTPRSGAVVDVDSIVNVQGGVPIGMYVDAVQNRLDEIHETNKRLFFECLTHDMLQELEPMYE
jgi:uncharacterized protein (TIGR04255 family)